MKIEGIVLQQGAEAQLDAFLSAPTHAILLAGPKGNGKTHVAAAISSKLLEVPNLENHAYYRIVKPEEKEGITIDQIRELISFFRLKVPGRAKIRRIAVLQDADLMGIPAQNALLKLLEEPPTDSVLILTSSQPQSLLPTIRSRLQLLQLGSPSTETLQAHFEGLGYSKQAVATALLRSGTDVAAAERVLNGESELGATSVDLAKQALGGSSYDRLLLVDSLAKQKDATMAFVDTLATVASASLQSAASRGSSVDRWETVLRAAHTAREALEQSGNAKLVLTELMLTI